MEEVGFQVMGRMDVVGMERGQGITSNFHFQETTLCMSFIFPSPGIN